MLSGSRFHATGKSQAGPPTAAIDRRFYRNKYDARKALGRFSARLPNETDLDGLNAELVTVVRETMQPEHVSAWLRPVTPLKAEQAE
jgi:hypothetical protein